MQVPATSAGGDLQNHVCGVLAQFLHMVICYEHVKGGAS
jgi:hypothetical protein